MGLPDYCQMDIVAPVLKLAQGESQGVASNCEIQDGVYWGVHPTSDIDTIAEVYVHVPDIEHVREPDTPLAETETLQPVLRELSHALHAIAGETPLIDSSVPLSLKRVDKGGKSGVHYTCELKVDTKAVRAAPSPSKQGSAEVSDT